MIASLATLQNWKKERGKKKQNKTNKQTKPAL
jgi:hypothetical protein